jgi:hypothetical protein
MRYASKTEEKRRRKKKRKKKNNKNKKETPLILIPWVFVLGSFFIVSKRASRLE